MCVRKKPIMGVIQLLRTIIITFVKDYKIPCSAIPLLIRTTLKVNACKKKGIPYTRYANSKKKTFTELK